MTVRLPDPQQPHAAQAGQPTPNILTDAVIQAAVENAIDQARRSDSSPHAVIGTAPPVPQPGRPPMSETATNVSGVMVASSIPILALGAAGTGILWASGNADPTVIGLIVATPAALAIPILALSRLVKRGKEAVQAAPPTHHHHYNGDVHQRTVNTHTSGVWAKTNTAEIR